MRFSHGLTGTGEENSIFCASLARRGYVGASIHHRDGSTCRAPSHVVGNDCTYYAHMPTGDDYDPKYSLRQVHVRAGEFLKARSWLVGRGGGRWGGGGGGDSARDGGDDDDDDNNWGGRRQIVLRMRRDDRRGIQLRVLFGYKPRSGLLLLEYRIVVLPRSGLLHREQFGIRPCYSHSANCQDQD